MAAPILTINQLKQGVRLTQMNVRVIHKWTRPNISDKTKTDTIELLLLDVENVIIQATITRQLISFFYSKITVGKAYNIRNLTVGNNSGYDKATPNPCRLKFEFSSKVQEINDTSIPVHGYRFSKFADIIGDRCPTTHYIGITFTSWVCFTMTFIVSDSSFMTDVVGKLYEIGPIIETRHGHRCRTIKLEDIDGCHLSCTLWPPHMDRLPALISEQPNPNQSKIVVMRFQVKFIVADMTDEEAAFVVFDSQLLAEIEKAGDHDSIPRELEAFIDKSFVFKIEIHENYNVCNGSKSYTVLHMSDDNDLSEKWHAKYTELFKAELDTFKSSTKDIMVRVANAKVIKASNTKDLSDGVANNLHGSYVHIHQDEDSVTADTSPNVTPLKRSFSRMAGETWEMQKPEYGIGDASSATKKPVIVKTENLS
ncbi:hypothetical protein RND81_11G174100 [Saponaria officinalis]|uniref:Replication protein A 70 kDa DNA-binding subunit B/D first OB fold domain-containing protein n=1 Tax=Saponaria officinalis TaxID=3572 RepID=A0AAW1HNC6_SAPOF